MEKPPNIASSILPDARFRCLSANSESRTAGQWRHNCVGAAAREFPQDVKSFSHAKTHEFLINCAGKRSLLGVLLRCGALRRQHYSFYKESLTACADGMAALIIASEICGDPGPNAALKRTCQPINEHFGWTYFAVALSVPPGAAISLSSELVSS